MLFAECDGRVSLACNGGSLAAKLMHAKAYRSCHCLAERMLRCVSTTASLRTDPQRLIWKAEEPKWHGVVSSYMDSRVLRRQVKIRRSLAVLTQANAAFQLRV